MLFIGAGPQLLAAFRKNTDLVIVCELSAKRNLPQVPLRYQATRYF